MSVEKLEDGREPAALRTQRAHLFAGRVRTTIKAHPAFMHDVNVEKPRAAASPTVPVDSAERSDSPWAAAAAVGALFGGRAAAAAVGGLPPLSVARARVCLPRLQLERPGLVFYSRTNTNFTKLSPARAGAAPARQPELVSLVSQHAARAH